MNNEKNYKERVNELIDKLNEDDRAVLTKDEEDDQYLKELLETAKMVKRQKNLAHTFEVKPRRYKSSNVWKKVAAVACLVAILFASGLLLINNDNNVVYASQLEEAFNKLSGYKGTMNYYIENNGIIEVDTTIDVTYMKPNLFRAEHHNGDRTVTKIYDGGSKMYIIDGDSQVIDSVSAETESIALNYYHLGEAIEEITKNATELKKQGKDIIAGREVDIYNFTNEVVPVTYQVYLDREMELPLKLEIQFENGLKVVSFFTKIEFNPVIDKSIFTYEIDTEKPIIDNTDKQPKESVKEVQKDALAYYINASNKVVWIDAPFYDYDELIYKVSADDIKANSLVKVDITWDDEDKPVIEKIEYAQSAQVTIKYVGLIDNNFGEFILNEMSVSFGLDEKVKDVIQKLSENQEITVKLQSASWSGVPVITEIVE